MRGGREIHCMRENKEEGEIRGREKKKNCRRGMRRRRRKRKKVREKRGKEERKKEERKGDGEALFLSPYAHMKMGEEEEVSLSRPKFFPLEREREL